MAPTNIFPLLFFVVVGSGIRKPGSESQDPGRPKAGFGINIPNPQRCKHLHARHFGMIFGHYSYEGTFITTTSLSSADLKKRKMED